MIREAEKILKKPKPVRKPKKKTQAQIFELPSKSNPKKRKPPPYLK